jgi:hypothetical protein
LHRDIGGGGRTVDGLQVRGFHKPVVSRRAGNGFASSHRILEDIKKISRPNFHIMWIQEKLTQYNVLKCGINALFPLTIDVAGKRA